MNWQKAAIEDLKKYPMQKDSLENVKKRIGALKEKYQSIKCTLSDTTPVMGGSSRIEDHMLDNIVERKRLEHTYRATARLVELVERGLSGLDERERLVLERFYVQKNRNHVERLMEEMHFEKTRVYEFKDDALYKFTISMYGIIDY